MNSKANLVFDKFIREPRNRRPCTAINLNKMDEEKFSQKKKESFLLEKMEMELEVEGRGGCPQQVLVYVGEIYEHLRGVEVLLIFMFLKKILKVFFPMKGIFLLEQILIKQVFYLSI